MNKQEKAALVIADAIETEGGNAALHLDLATMTDAIAQALADAGLLMPELPEPDLDNSNPAYCAEFKAWWDGPVPNVWNKNLPGGVTIQVFPDRPEVQMYEDEEPMEPFSAEEARSVAYALLAAADYAEQEQKQ